MKYAWSLLILVLVPIFARAPEDQKKLTIAEVVNNLGLETRVATPDWMPSGDAYLRWEPPAGWLRYDVTGGKGKPYLALATLTDAFAALPGLDHDRAESMLQADSGEWNRGRDALLFNIFNDLFLYRLASGTAIRLTHDAAEEVGVEFSPDGRMISFIRDFNIHIVSLDTFAIRQLTRDGNRSLLYGRLDWVYQEELYGRGNFSGYWWAPDSASLAFLRIDESDVPDYTVVDHLPYHPDLEVTHYPKAGDPNPRVQLGVVPASGGDITWMDTFAYEGSEFLVVRVAWHPSAIMLTAQIQNREQTWLDLVAFDPRTGRRATLVEERSKTWVEVLGQPVWSPDGKQFVWNSERDGYNHLYLYEVSGKLVKQLTSGPWEASQALAFSADGKAFYYEENRDAILEQHCSRIILESGASERLTLDPGTHSIDCAPGARYFFDRFSSMEHPGRLQLCNDRGKPLSTLAEADTAVPPSYGLTAPEFLQVPTRDGFIMEAMLIKPPHFDPARQYPVMSHTYSGPHAPRVRNRWDGSNYLWHQMLAADLNCLIWICDNRTASGKGKVSVDPLYRHFGEWELRDLEDGIAWLKRQPYVDGERIGLWGWSFGGYMTLYALTHSKSFKLGIAGAPVTDWRNYDTIYTERYMAMPQNNPEGYLASSPLHNAADLTGELLLIHGTVDDNVHLQNSIQMIHALQLAGKQFTFMTYPKSRHAVRNKQQRLHLYTLMTDFLRQNL